jgi:RNA polymerase sigma factor (sigma-70 family)
MFNYPVSCARIRRQKSILEDLRRFDRIGTTNPSKIKPLGATSGVPALDQVERKKTVTLLALRIAQLPQVPKKVLAMYYCENMPLSEIAACFGLTEYRIRQIRTKTVALLRNDLLSSLG